MTIQEAEDAIGPLIFHKLREVTKQSAGMLNSHLLQHVRYFVIYLYPNREYHDRLIRAINKAYNSNEWDRFGKWFYSNHAWQEGEF